MFKEGDLVISVYHDLAVVIGQGYANRTTCVFWLRTRSNFDYPTDRLTRCAITMGGAVRVQDW